jgi:hypothetical protein
MIDSGPIFGPDFAERLEATWSLIGMLALLKRCLAGQFSLEYTERVRAAISITADEICDNPVMVVEA